MVVREERWLLQDSSSEEGDGEDWCAQSSEEIERENAEDDVNYDDDWQLSCNYYGFVPLGENFNAVPLPKSLTPYWEESGKDFAKTLKMLLHHAGGQLQPGRQVRYVPPPSHDSENCMGVNEPIPLIIYSDAYRAMLSYLTLTEQVKKVPKSIATAVVYDLDVMKFVHGRN